MGAYAVTAVAWHSQKDSNPYFRVRSAACYPLHHRSKYPGGEFDP